MRITIVGHRGCRGLVTENTLESIAKAVALGVSVIEYDLRLTKDKVLVLSHDGNSKRIFSKDIKISEARFSELQKLLTKDNEQIATLEEVLTNTPDRIHHLIELKDPNSSEILLQQLDKIAHPKKRIAITTFEWSNLSDLQPRREFMRVFAATKWRPFKALRQPADGIMMRFWMLNPAIYWLAAKKDKKIALYTVNNSIVMRAIDLLYPQVLVCTDRPDRFVKVK